MELIEVVSRHRNDYVWIGRCRNCGHKQRYGDGYADHFYATKVIPHRHCPKCGKDCYGHKDDTP